MNKDNWKHRSTGMRCSSCMYYVSKTKTQTGQIIEDGKDVIITPSIGRCRRHAPTMSGWPVMFQTDWCGDHKLDEEKI